MPISTCRTCNKEYKHGRSCTGIYCSLECTFEGQRSDTRKKFIEGRLTTRAVSYTHLTLPTNREV